MQVSDSQQSNPSVHLLAQQTMVFQDLSKRHMQDCAMLHTNQSLRMEIFGMLRSVYGNSVCFQVLDPHQTRAGFA